jgi:hypothetical protein
MRDDPWDACLDAQSESASSWNHEPIRQLYESIVDTTPLVFSIGAFTSFP